MSDFRFSRSRWGATWLAVFWWNCQHTVFRIRLCHHPFRAMLGLLYPFSCHLPFRQQFSPNARQENPKLIVELHKDIFYLRDAPLFGYRDTPLRSLYRLYELMVLQEMSSVTLEAEYFFYRSSWTLSTIPDPKDTDPARYAILACLVDALAQSYNFRIGLGILRCNRWRHPAGPIPPLAERLAAHESPPSWVHSVPAVGEPLWLCSHDQKHLSPIFKSCGIYTNAGSLRWI
jgi:hypothetical protein